MTVHILTSYSSLCEIWSDGGKRNDGGNKINQYYRDIKFSANGTLKKNFTKMYSVL